MNFYMIFNVLGWVCKFEAVFLLFPGLVGLIYNEKTGVAFLLAAIICGLVGFILGFFKPKNKNLYARDGFAIVSFSWILISLFGALPFILRVDPVNMPQVSFINAFFESASGFTTTGATIFDDLEILPQCILFWRSLTHWIGGVGVLVFIMAFLPLSGAGNMNMMKAESTGPNVGKFVPKVRTTAIIMCSMYFGLTVIEMICLLIARMPFFDALTTSFSTAGTGGFALHNESIAYYQSPAIEIIVGIFMLLFSFNFGFYFLLIAKKFKSAFTMSEIIVFLGIVGVSVGLCTANIMATHVYDNFGDGLRNSFFTISSLMSSTGFVTVDYSIWPMFSKVIIILVMFIGACAGSTGGGIKVSRIIIMSKSMVKELQAQAHPNMVTRVTMDGREVSKETIKSVTNYLCAFVIVFIISLIIVSLNEFDFATSFTSVTATLNNTGPICGIDLGPTNSYNSFSVLSKSVFVFDMIAGRLELYPILVLFTNTLWRK